MLPDRCFCAFAELPRDCWVSILGKCDMDARIAAQRTNKLDPARWQFLHLLLQARLQRRAIAPHWCSPFADKLEHSFSIHREYDASVCYKFFAYGQYCREYCRVSHNSTLNQYKQWRLHDATNKYSCYVSEDSDTDMSDSDTVFGDAWESDNQHIEDSDYDEVSDAYWEE